MARRINLKQHEERLVVIKGVPYLYYEADGRIKRARLNEAQAFFHKLAERLDMLTKRQRATILGLLEVNYCISCGGVHQCGCPDGSERWQRAWRLESLLEKLARAADVKSPKRLPRVSAAFQPKIR